MKFDGKMLEADPTRKVYRPDDIELRKEGDDLVISDPELDCYENGVLMTLGHKMTDLPEEMLEDFAKEMVKVWNGGSKNKLIIDYDSSGRGISYIDLIKPTEEGKIRRLRLDKLCGAEIIEIAIKKVKKHQIGIIEVDKNGGGQNLIDALEECLIIEDLGDVKVRPLTYVAL